MSNESPVIYTIGHSNHSLEEFISLLKRHGITALCDVRSQPYSRMNPQFNRETLKQALLKADIGYVFLGKEMGARSEDPFCYISGKVNYDRLARTDLFREGIERLRKGLETHSLALMCAERDPLECHRTILVARRLDLLGIEIKHILADGSLELHRDTIIRLLRQLRLPEEDLLRSHEEMIEDAYRMQGERIAYGVKEHPAKREKIGGVSK